MLTARHGSAKMKGMLSRHFASFKYAVKQRQGEPG
jgi:hypothetical protein